MQKAMIRDMTDDLLHRICGKLQISDSQRDRAKGHYEAVGAYLAKNEELYAGADMQIYPQGSLRIGTTVKPMAWQEFDVDIVVEFDAKWRGKDPIELIDAVEKYFRESKVYAPMVERCKRCVRLNYANEFHMDILPAVPADDTNDGCLKVPDRKAKNWKDSNPKGYANWFEKKAEQVFKVFMEKSAEIEPFPRDETVNHKPPLKRAVQLIKRYRDKYFEENPKDAPISIVLTTLAARHYNGTDSVNEALSVILKGILESVPKTGRLVVKNPKNDKEDLSERWDAEPEKYEVFLQFIREFKTEWDLMNAQQGIPNVSEKLKAMFGVNVTVEALNEQAAFIQKARKSGQLKVYSTSGGLTMVTAGAVAVKTNTFFGSDD